MRNSSNYFLPLTDTESEPEEKSRALPGAVIGFISWLLALGIPFLLYGLNTPFFFLYTWPFFLALLPLSVIAGIAMHTLLRGRLLFSGLATLLLVGLFFGVLLLWLLT